MDGIAALRVSKFEGIRSLAKAILTRTGTVLDCWLDIVRVTEGFYSEVD